ncbi:MAG: anion permease, partial [Myxococcota bacterium]
MEAAGQRTTVQTVGLLLGPLLVLGLALVDTPTDVGVEAWSVAGLLILMAIWWATEAIPVPATSLLPLVVLPLVGGGTAQEAASGYASPIVLLLMGG